MNTDKKKTGRPLLHHILALTLAAVSVIAIVYYGSLPVSYDYKIGSIAVSDIYAPRSFTDTYETERRAIIARENADDIFVKSTNVSDENISPDTEKGDPRIQARRIHRYELDGISFHTR